MERRKSVCGLLGPMSWQSELASDNVAGSIFAIISVPPFALNNAFSTSAISCGEGSLRSCGIHTVCLLVRVSECVFFIIANHSQSNWILNVSAPGKSMFLGSDRISKNSLARTKTTINNGVSRWCTLHKLFTCPVQPYQAPGNLYSALFEISNSARIRWPSWLF